MGDDSAKARDVNLGLSDPDKNLPKDVMMKKLELEGDIYRWVIKFLGVAILLVILVVAVLVGLGKTTPDGVIAIGSAAVGAMAGILAPSPAAAKG
jgi:hypothetical protein